MLLDDFSANKKTNGLAFMGWHIISCLETERGGWQLTTY